MPNAEEVARQMAVHEAVCEEQPRMTPRCGSLPHPPEPANFARCRHPSLVVTSEMGRYLNMSHSIPSTTGE